MEQEYIKGDIVMYNNKIHIIMDTLGVNNYELSYISHPVHQLELSGVPITPDILEKNGWKKIFREYLGCDNVGIFWLNENIGDCAEFEEFNRHFSPKIFKLPIIHYIHQLQHYFFGLNIKIKIEV